jgi:hypothetical protein
MLASSAYLSRGRRLPRSSGNFASFERTLSVNRDYGAINGITNELGRAMELMSEHVSTRFGADSFVLAHNPTEGFWADIGETAWDKAGFTTAISQHFGPDSPHTHPQPNE